MTLSANRLLLSSSGPDIGTTIAKSLRFNSADTAYLSRTMTQTPTSDKTGTFAILLKRSKLGVAQSLYGTPSNFEFADFTANNELRVSNPSGTPYWVSNPLYRDSSAWMQVVIVYDTPNATAADRCIAYVNGTRVTWSSSPAITQNTAMVRWAINTFANYVGSTNAGTNPFDGYIAEFIYVDGQALPATSFGRFSADTGEWVPATYAGTYGKNGFRLDFSDNSGTTSGTLGKDRSGNNNDWTPTGFSVAAGVGNDSLTDTPTNNYCTLNPLDSVAGMITNGALDFSGSAGSNENVTGTFSFDIATDKVYFETTMTTLQGYVGILAESADGNKSGTVAGAFYSCYAGTAGSAHQKSSSYGSAVAYSATTTTAGEVLGVRCGNGEVEFYKDGVSLGVAYSGLTGRFKPWGMRPAGGTQSYNFGQRPFAATPPSGYKALCTDNLPTPTILKPRLYADAVPYTGNGSTQNVVNNGFQPAIAWLKSRSVARQHRLIDSVRGVNNALATDSSINEWSGTAVTAMNSNGIALQNADSSNVSSESYIAWMLRGGTGVVTNNAGSVSSNVNANPLSGVSVVTFTTPASGDFTVGHGLSVAPQVVLVKNRNNLAQGWWVYHAGSNASPATGYMQFDSTNGFVGSAIWANTAPTSTVFTLRTSAIQASTNYVAYCFADAASFAKHGWFIGNGSADGPYVHCGFRPALVILKEASASGNHWFLYDEGRDPYNVVGAEQYPNLATVDGNGVTNGRPVDFLSNGFKMRGPNNINTAGVTVIYMAFAQAPFKYARAR